MWVLDSWRAGPNPYEVKKNTVRLYNIGTCSEHLGATGKALRCFREYLRTEPSG